MVNKDRGKCTVLNQNNPVKAITDLFDICLFANSSGYLCVKISNTNMARFFFYKITKFIYYANIEKLSFCPICGLFRLEVK